LQWNQPFFCSTLGLAGPLSDLHLYLCQLVRLEACYKLAAVAVPLTPQLLLPLLNFLSALQWNQPFFRNTLGLAGTLSELHTL
jgi:hypothetical protein